MIRHKGSTTAVGNGLCQVLSSNNHRRNKGGIGKATGTEAAQQLSGGTRRTGSITAGGDKREMSGRGPRSYRRTTSDGDRAVNEAWRREQRDELLQAFDMLLAWQETVAEDLAAVEEIAVGEGAERAARARRTANCMRGTMRAFRARLENLGGYPTRLAAEDVPVGTQVYVTDHVERSGYLLRSQVEPTDSPLVRYAVVTGVEENGVWLQNRVGERLWRPFGRVILAPEEPQE